jgi:ATP/maltotriose-dependent transcriptional regulator MalT
LVATVGEFWEFTDRFREGQGWLAQALAAGPEAPTAERSWALSLAGLMVHRLGDHEAAEALTDQAAEMARGLNLPRHEGLALLIRGIVAEDRGDYDGAEPRLAAARHLLRQVGDHWQAALATYHLGIVAYGRGQFGRAQALLEQAMAEAVALGDTMVPVWCLRFLGLLAIEQGELRRAADALRECAARGGTLALEGKLGGQLFATLAVLGSAGGTAEIAARLLGAAAAIGERGWRADLPERLAFERSEVRLRQVMGESAFAAAWAEGQTLSPEETEAAMDAILDAAATADPTVFPTK